MVNIQEERKAFIEWSLLNNFDVSEIKTEELGALFVNPPIQSAWMGWISCARAKQEKLEGCVVVPKDQIEVWWQDADEPENFATKEDDLSFIAQHIEDDEIMEINEHHTIHLPSITKFGTWIYQSGQRKFFVGTKDEVEAARGGNE